MGLGDFILQVGVEEMEEEGYIRVNNLPKLVFP